MSSMGNKNIQKAGVFFPDGCQYFGEKTVQTHEAL